MLRRAFSIAVLLSVAAFGQQARIGKPAGEDKIKAMDITVFPDGRGLPAGSGTAAKGKDIFKEKCAVCHNDQAQGREGQYPSLVGGKGTINTPKPVKTVGSYWPYATTVFDYVRRAMPWDKPKSLTDEEVYAVAAYVLSLNGVIGQDEVLDAQSLPKVKMPNRDGFTAFPRWPPK
jgi:mono/diheme cytochrome c family protein